MAIYWVVYLRKRFNRVSRIWRLKWGDWTCAQRLHVSSQTKTKPMRRSPISDLFAGRHTGQKRARRRKEVPSLRALNARNDRLIMPAIQLITKGLQTICLRLSH